MLALQCCLGGGGGGGGGGLNPSSDNPGMGEILGNPRIHEQAKG